MSDYGLTDPHGRAWSDAFPWLPGPGADEAGCSHAWWDKTIDDVEVAKRKEVINRIAALAINHLGRWPIGDVFPGLESGIALEKLDLPMRARNVLSREGRALTDDLVDLTVDELLAFQNAGIGTVTAILQELAGLSTSSSHASMPPTAAEQSPVEPARPWLGALLGDLEALAEWNHSIGRLHGRLLDPLPPGAPESVVEARGRVNALSASQVLPTSATNVADVLEHEIAAMEERYRILLTERLFSSHARTLADLGQEFGVSRERVRQLESKALGRLMALISGDGAVGRVARLVRSEIRGVRPLTDLLSKVPALEFNVMSVGQPAWRIIDVLDDAYEIADGWCAEPSLEAAQRDTAVYLDELADEFGVVRISEISLVGSEEVRNLPWLTDWLAYLGYEIREQYVLLKTGSLNDLAAAILSVEGGPLNIEDLHAKIGRGSQNSLRNQLYIDPNFHRIDREHWAMTSWGLETYTNIRAEIGKLLDQAEGEVPLATVVESLVQRFGVSPNSVTVYAGSAPFQVWNGMVRKQTNVYATGSKNPAKVQGYYRRGNDWLYRTTVTQDHLRGSGWPASTALATILGMAPGEYAELPSRLGNQKFSYKGHQPSYGSVRRFLEDLDLSVGDQLFLVFKSDGTFDAEPLPKEPADNIAKALRLVGADMDVPIEQTVGALGAAIKFSPDADVVSVAEGYRARGEQRIHDLILGVESG